MPKRPSAGVASAPKGEKQKAKAPPESMPALPMCAGQPGTAVGGRPNDTIMNMVEKGAATIVQGAHRAQGMSRADVI